MKRIIIVPCRDPWAEEKREGDQIWCVNTAFMAPTSQKNIDRMYFSDTFKSFVSLVDKNFAALLNATGAEIWCQNHLDEVKRSKRIPVEEMIERWGVKYFTSTIAYMIAHALYEGCDELILYKVNSAVASQEYYHQKSCHDFWCGVAKGMGVKISVSSDSFLMKPHPWCTPLYGFWEQESEEKINAFMRLILRDIMRHPMKLIEISPVKGFKPTPISYQSPRMLPIRRV